MQYAHTLTTVEKVRDELSHALLFIYRGHVY